MKVDSKNEYKVFKRIALVLLILLVIELPIFLLIRKVSYGHYINLILAGSGEEEANKELLDVPMLIYRFNCVLCIISLIVQAVYWILRIIDSKAFEKKTKYDFKSFFSKNWPCILLAIFMAWTSVGCIQAGMEMDAEIIVNKAIENNEEPPERLVEIANWSPTKRMNNTTKIYQNAKDRAWHGCENLKDGYFSFLFYAAVMLNVLMLGVGSENYKRYIMRTLLLSSFFIGLCTFFAFFRYDVFRGYCYFDRSIFNNRNHFGYYIATIYIMSVCLFINDKNIYFKSIAFLNALLYTWHIFVCDTFGTYLGVLCGMIFLFVVLLIRMISDKKTVDFVKYCFFLVLFIVWSLSFVSANSTMYTAKADDYTPVAFDYATFTFNFNNDTYMISLNTMSDEEAKEKGITSKKIYFGNKINKLEEHPNNFIKQSFIDLGKDFGKILEFFKKEELVANNSSGESGNTTDFISSLAGLSQQEAYNKIFERYPSVSGETLEEYMARQTKIEEEVQQYQSRFVNNKSGENTSKKSESDISFDDLSNVGSGRGPTWIRSLDLMNQRPWFGWGLENLLNEFYEQYNVSEGRTHNLVLQLGGTTGIPGAFMYLIATISIWLKVMFDAEIKKYEKGQLYIIAGVYLISTIVVNILVSSAINKLFFNGFFTVAWWAILTWALFIRKIRLRVRAFNEFEFIGAAVFVSYMISSLFGNSAFYTSPYFMIFLGILTHEAIYKESIKEIENKE